MHHHRHGPGFGGPRIIFRGGFPNRQELLERLENHQRDLEQQLADIADVIAHLRDRPRTLNRSSSTRRLVRDERQGLGRTLRSLEPD